MTIFEIAVTIFAAVTVSVIVALIIAYRKLVGRIDTLAAENAALEQKLLAVREQNQQELLAIGQRVLEADKIVRRFSERLDSIENNSTSDQPQYGQLQALLAKTSQEGEASAAEAELLSLLKRNRK